MGVAHSSARPAKRGKEIQYPAKARAQDEQFGDLVPTTLFPSCVCVTVDDRQAKLGPR